VITKDEEEISIVVRPCSRQGRGQQGQEGNGW